MSSIRRNSRVSYKAILGGVLFIIVIFFDATFGTSRFPICTLALCGIVVLYECISPYIYSSR